MSGSISSTSIPAVSEINVITPSKPMAEKELTQARPGVAPQARKQVAHSEQPSPSALQESHGTTALSKKEQRKLDNCEKEIKEKIEDYLGQKWRNDILRQFTNLADVAKKYNDALTQLVDKNVSKMTSELSPYLLNAETQKTRIMASLNKIKPPQHSSVEAARKRLSDCILPYRALPSAMGKYVISRTACRILNDLAIRTKHKFKMTDEKINAAVQKLMEDGVFPVIIGNHLQILKIDDELHKKITKDYSNALAELDALPRNFPVAQDGASAVLTTDDYRNILHHSFRILTNTMLLQWNDHANNTCGVMGAALSLQSAVSQTIDLARLDGFYPFVATALTVASEKYYRGSVIVHQEIDRPYRAEELPSLRAIYAAQIDTVNYNRHCLAAINAKLFLVGLTSVAAADKSIDLTRGQELVGRHVNLFNGPLKRLCANIVDRKLADNVIPQHVVPVVIQQIIRELGILESRFRLVAEYYCAAKDKGENFQKYLWAPLIRTIDAIRDVKEWMYADLNDARKKMEGQGSSRSNIADIEQYVRKTFNPEETGNADAADLDILIAELQPAVVSPLIIKNNAGTDAKQLAAAAKKFEADEKKRKAERLDELTKVDACDADFKDIAAKVDREIKGQKNLAEKAAHDRNEFDIDAIEKPIRLAIEYLSSLQKKSKAFARTFHDASDELDKIEPASELASSYRIKAAEHLRNVVSLQNEVLDLAAKGKELVLDNIERRYIQRPSWELFEPLMAQLDAPENRLLFAWKVGLRNRTEGRGDFVEVFRIKLSKKYEITSVATGVVRTLFTDMVELHLHYAQQTGGEATRAHFKNDLEAQLPGDVHRGIVEPEFIEATLACLDKLLRREKDFN